MDDSSRGEDFIYNSWTDDSLDFAHWMNIQFS